ncbi:MAG TPA: sigma-54 dependent transcriptional regulator [Polyangiaceae bacterium]|jgi:DNA-binding NtrC family response regulator
MLEVLLVEDDDDVRESIAAALTDAGHFVAQASDGQQAAAMASVRTFDLAICDVNLPHVDGLTLVRRIHKLSPETALVVMTSHGSVPDVVRSMREGAVDYVLKPFDPVEFVAKVVTPIADERTVRRAVEEARARTGRDEARAGRRIVAISGVMQLLVGRLKALAHSDASILLRGETGTGKKSLARLLHEESPRRGGPFVVVPCSALPDLMMDAELRELASGCTPGRRDAWFHAADGGTLVLDAVEDLPLEAQSSLIRVLSEPDTAARRGNGWQPRGVRVVATSRQDLAGRVALRQFLDGLYFRIAGFVLEVPPLRERDGDLVPLIAELLSRAAGARSVSLSTAARVALARYSFPGNVSELDALLEGALQVAGAGPIDAPHLPPRVARGAEMLDTRRTECLPI